MSERIRSFIAFDINNDAVLQKFGEAQHSLLDVGADLKIVQPKNIHITMRFLGDITQSMIEPIQECMKKVTFAAFDCEITGLGVFPNVRYPRVVWAGIRKGSEELKNVFEQLEPQLNQLGFRADQKGFSPHLTLARVKTGRSKVELVRCIQDMANYNFGVVKADCLRLKKSILTPKGPIYSTLEEVCR